MIEDMFGGLDRSYQVHRTAGVIASVLVHFFTSPNYPPKQWFVPHGYVGHDLFDHWTLIANRLFHLAPNA